MCARVIVEILAADDDGFITFEEFMVSYARPKPILKNLLIMAINTAVIFFILQAPWLDTMIKVGRVCWLLHGWNAACADCWLQHGLRVLVAACAFPWLLHGQWGSVGCCSRWAGTRAANVCYQPLSMLA